MKIRTHYYQQFGADAGLDVPAEGFGGWKTAELAIDPRRTAVVAMHAWDCGTAEEYPGWRRCAEYIPRAQRILREVFPRLLAAVRASELRLFHVVGGADYYRQYEGHRRAVELAGPAPEAPEQIEPDPALEALRAFRADHVVHGAVNREDVRRGFGDMKDFPPEARPVGAEGVAENAHQLFALCKEAGVNHLVYAGFAINWCLLLSPGGIAEMSRRGFLCSALRQAVTAVENKESARDQMCKQLALWRVAAAFGFVYDVDDFVAAISGG